jgi:hypothetical protein
MTSPARKEEEEVLNRSTIRMLTGTNAYQHTYEQERSLVEVAIQIAASTHSVPLENRGLSITNLTSLEDECKHEDFLPKSRACEDAQKGIDKEDLMSIAARRLQRSLEILRGDRNDNTWMFEDTVTNQDTRDSSQEAGLLSFPSGIESLSQFLEKVKQQRKERSGGVTKDDDDCSFPSFDSLKYYRRERSSSTLNDTSIGSTAQSEKDSTSSR